MIEEFRTIKDYPKYEVSNLGKVRNKNNMKLLSQQLTGREDRTYYTVSFQSKTFFVHRLVAQAFIPNPENKEQVDHINGDRYDNSVNNLRWMTNTENQRNKGRGKNNKTGYKNISWDKSLNKYRFCFHSSTKGRYNTLKEAIKARDEFLEKTGNHLSLEAIRRTETYPEDTETEDNIDTKKEVDKIDKNDKEDKTIRIELVIKIEKV